MRQLSRFLALRVSVIGLLALVLTPSQEGAAEERVEPVKLAILPIVVHSADDPGFLREGLQDMLISRFDQIGVFDVVRIDPSVKGTTRLGQATAAGKGAGADFVLFGSFTRFGQGASLDMQCASTTRGEGDRPLREIFVHAGNIGEVIPDLDDLVGKVTRFAVEGYRADSSVAAGPPDPTIGEPAQAADSPDLDELRNRIQDLEAAVSDLQAASEE
jgi:TolB-like protein